MKTSCFTIKQKKEYRNDNINTMPWWQRRRKGRISHTIHM